MLTADFDYELPKELIAQEPWPVRDECKMLVLHREDGSIEHKTFKDIIDFLNPGDLLVANETRVIPARLLGRKRGTGGVCEIFLLRPMIEDEVNNKAAKWEVLVKPGKRLKPGTGALVDFEDADGNVLLSAEIVEWASDPENAQKGERVALLTTKMTSLDEAFHAVGHTPLPPYIKDYCGDEEMYQTVYSKHEGSAAAPTAGLHFTPELIEKCKEKGIGWATVDLEVGLDTFRIPDEENAEDHKMHTETYSVPEETARAINETKARGGRVIAVGTTSVRSLESAARRASDDEFRNPPVEVCSKRRIAKLPDGFSPSGASSKPQQPSGENHLEGPFELHPCTRETTSLYLMPGAEFKVVDAMVTNFHVPKSTLMMLVSAFATRDQIMAAYEKAKAQNYRFLSFGDAMLIL